MQHNFFEGNVIFKLIQPEYLDTVSLVLAALNLFFIVQIFIRLQLKKKNLAVQKGIQKSIELWISRILLDENESDSGAAYLHTPDKLKYHFKSRAKREFTVNQLIDIKKNLTGKLVENVIHVYQHLGFKKDSLRKLNSSSWQKKVRGIHELYMMDQKDVLPLIYQYANSQNEFIRMEAQTAMIHFYGFDGLRFLDIVTHPVSDWEQLKLLEQLRVLDFVGMKNLSGWLKSPNDSVIIFALKLAEVYQQYQVHEEVVGCLSHENEKVRMQAVKTLVKIAGEGTAAILARQYYREQFTSKQNILHCLTAIASNSDEPFLVKQLDDPNDFLKLSAARVMARCCDNGFEILKAKATKQPDPYQEIYFHLKSEQH